MRETYPGVLLVSTTAMVGGLERVVVAVSRGLRERGWAVRTVVPAWGDDRFVQWCRSQGVEPELASVLRSWGGLSLRAKSESIKALAQFFQHAAADVVNVHYGGGQISFKDLLAVRLAGVRHCVVSVHHPWSWQHTGQSKRIMTFLAAALADAVIVPSEAVARVQRQAGVPAHKIQVIHNGVQEPALTLSQREARLRLGIDPSAVVIASLTRLVPEKGLLDLLRAAASLPIGPSRWCLVIGGDGPQRAELERFAQMHLSHNRVQFLGYTESSADVYAAADIFALPSSQEGFGMVFAEAAVHGVPSIGASVGGVPEVIAHETTGLLVTKGDIEGLTSALSRLMSDPETRLRYGRAARARALSEFTVQRMVDKYVGVLTPPAFRNAHRIETGTDSFRFKRSLAQRLRKGSEHDQQPAG